MVRIIVWGRFCCFLGGYYKNVDGYQVDVTWKTYHNLWEHPINLDSDEEQIIDVPFIKYGSYFSLCFDRERGNPVTLPDYGCPINGRLLMGIHVPLGFDREKRGQLRFRVRKRHYLKNIPNARIVLAWGHPAAK